MAISVVHNPEAQRFEATMDGQRAFAAYRLHGRTIVFTHTEVPQVLEGRGIGSALARAAFDYVRDAGLAPVPVCPFMASYMRRHPPVPEAGAPVRGGSGAT